MKKLKYIFLVGIPFLMFSSKCKDKEPIIFVLTGRIMNSCASPASNVEVTLKSLSNLLGSSGIRAEGTTDSNGYFRIEYEPSGVSYSLRAPYEVMKDIQVEQNLDLGEINVGGTVNFVIKLDVQNPYTANDTLYYYDWNYPQNGASHWVKKVAGPFVSGVIDTVKNMGYMKYPIRFGEVPKMDINHYINDFSENTNLYFNTPFCSTNYAEAVIKIE